MSLRQRTSLSFAALALAVAVLMSGCGATVNLRVSVGRSGSGSVALVVSFPAATAAQLEDLKAGLPVADLRAAGWVVEGPKPGPEGSTVVSASHTFSNLSQVPALVADVAGSGPERSRPFRLTVTELPGLLQDHYLASGTVDLRCWLSCFDDPRLAASVGYPLGLSPAEVHRLFGAHPGDELTFGFEVLLPGTVTSSDASAARRPGERPGLVPRAGQGDDRFRFEQDREHRGRLRAWRRRRCGSSRRRWSPPSRSCGVGGDAGEEASTSVAGDGGGGPWTRTVGRDVMPDERTSFT